MYILDTDIISYFLRSYSENVTRNFRSHDKQELGITSVSVFELTYGASLNFSPDDVRYEKVIGLITEMRMFALTGKSARRAGSLKASFKDRGMILQDMDIMIAAICLENNGTLVTHNKKYFERIKGLKIEDWVD